MQKAVKDEINDEYRLNPIAIIGMSCVFADSRNIKEFWENIINKKDCISEVPPSRWNKDNYYNEDPKTRDKVYCIKGGFIPDIDFNPMEFGLPPNILEAVDSSQLLALVLAKQAVEDAGYGESREFNRERVGVVVGASSSKQLAYTLANRLEYPVWEKVLKSCGIPKESIDKAISKMKLAYVEWQEDSFAGYLNNVIAGRVANRLNFGGTNCSVDAACASSLGALKVAISELQERRCDMMIAGGVDTDNAIFSYMSFSKTNALSKKQIMRPFDTDADGTMIGEGVGMLVLKRLADAERDNDRIYAVIRGIGSSSDGRAKSIFAPSAEGQYRALKRAYQEAGFPAADVRLIEAHGTSTNLGDQTEINSLTRFFSENNSKPHSVALGSVKSQIGHTKAAAGSASLIKSVLALYHKVIPPTINVTKPNPKLDLEASPLYLNVQARPWIRKAGEPPRRAGVSASGFGGANFHVVLEEYEAQTGTNYRINDQNRAVIVYADTPADLLAKCRDYIGKLKSDSGDKFFSEIISDSRINRIPGTSARLGLLCESCIQAAEMLTAAVGKMQKSMEASDWEDASGIFYRKTGMELSGKVVALFSGQGSQYSEMGRELANNFPVFKEMYSQFDKMFEDEDNIPLSEVVYPKNCFEEQQKKKFNDCLQRTEYTQPAIGALSAGMYKIFQNAGFKPDFAAGHSFGELTALWASGALNDQDYLYLVKKRGAAMAAPENPDFETGKMLAVKGDHPIVSEVIRNFPQVSVANWNSQDQVVVAGPEKQIKEVEPLLKEQGLQTFQLPVSAAFHTSMVKFAREKFDEALRSVKFSKPILPVYSNTTGDKYHISSKAIRGNLQNHMIKPVLFEQMIEEIYEKGGYLFIEFGPKDVLTKLVKSILGDRPCMTIALNDNSRQNSYRLFCESVLKLRIAGLDINDIDPCQMEYKFNPNIKKNSMSVKINAALYVSPQTKKAFEKALEEESVIAPEKAEPREALPKEYIDEIPEGLSLKTGINNFTDISIMENNEMLNTLKEVMSYFQEEQTERLKVYQQYLNIQHEYGRNFFQLLNDMRSFADNCSSPQEAAVKERLIASIDQSLSQFHKYQCDTLGVHERYISNLMEKDGSLIQLLSEQLGHGSVNYNSMARMDRFDFSNRSYNAEPLIVSPSTNRNAKLLRNNLATAEADLSNDCHQAENKVSMVQERQEPAIEKNPVIEKSVSLRIENESGDAAKIILRIISEKTGYPLDVIDTGMNLEADLGIDSIKRVEIMEAIQEKYSCLEGIDRDELSELKTIEDIACCLERQSGNSGAGNVIGSHGIKQEVMPVIEIHSDKDSNDGIINSLLAIISEKTGYPLEVLEPGMALEADLGIDSIKRVEIMGAVQEKYEGMNKRDSDQLSELRTIKEIAEYISKEANIKSSPADNSSKDEYGSLLKKKA